MRKNKKGIVFMLFFALLPVVAFAAFTAYMLRMDLIPMRYIVALCVGMAAAAGLCSALTVFSWQLRSALLRILPRVLSMLVSVAMIFGAYYMEQTFAQKQKVFKKAGTVSHVETTTYMLVVEKSSAYKKIQELNRKTVEEGPEDTAQEKAVKNMKSLITPNEVSVTSYDVMPGDLKSGKTDAILIDQATADALSEEEKTFKSDTRIIWKTTVEKGKKTAATATDKTFNLFISGSDSRGSVNATARSDVDMILTINPKTHKVLMTSIPRDYFVTIHGKNAKDKLTHAGILGTDTVVKTVEDFMNIKINYYIKVNFASVTKVVDELGGLNIYVDQDIKLWTYPGQQNKPLSKGWHHMDGKTALAFARERHSYKNGDSHRAQNQQDVLKAIIGKMMSVKMLTNYSSILSSIAGMFVTDFPDSMIDRLVKNQLSEGAEWHFTSYVLESTEEMRYGGYFMPNRKLYYAIPVQSSIDKARSQINAVLGETSAETSDTADQSDASDQNASSVSSSSGASSSGTENTESGSSGNTPDADPDNYTQKEAAM